MSSAHGHRRVVFLGPQRQQPTVRSTLRSLGVEPAAPVALVSAGWEERELEIAEFEEHVGGRVLNLEVYRRLEEVYTRDRGFRAVVQQRHDRLRDLQALYRLRLGHGLDAARSLMTQEGDLGLLEPERAAAIEAVRAIDAHHLRRVHEIQVEFREQHNPDSHPLVARFREDWQRQLADCSVLCIAGGHVGILLNRLRMAGVIEMWDAARPIVAWSAGAMVLTPQVVLFHDRPPQGQGNAEVFDAGFGVTSGIVPLPHAEKRLRLEDPLRVELFARRFAPSLGIALVDDTRLDWDGATWSGVSVARQLNPTGALSEVPA